MFVFSQFSDSIFRESGAIGFFGITCIGCDRILFVTY